MTLSARKLRRGMRFSEIPAAWHGPGVVTESYASGDIWCIKFDNEKVVNPPGVLYISPETKVRILKGGA
jgi:hypothetical protein